MKPTFPHDRYGNSLVFHEMMQSRMRVSHFKYGSLESNYPFPVNCMASLEQRLMLYRDTGNVEWLIDAANMCMIEALYPAHPEAYYRATTAEESPGLVKDEVDNETGSD